jgi:leucokinin receptor
VPGECDDRRDDRILRNKKKAIKVLMFVVGLFTVCWLPLQTYQVLSVIAPVVNE